MAKRSPIRGYNHNVSYRGVVFHVQTEDSGVDNPHIFTHLFYGGIIVSTRKLEYDAESAEESIKSLMQAQHKAVLKILTKGGFDDKIDAYLVGVEALLPSGTEEEPHIAPDVVAAAAPPVMPERVRPTTLSPELLEQLEPPMESEEPARAARDLPRVRVNKPTDRALPRHLHNVATSTERDLPMVHFRRPAPSPSPIDVTDDDVAQIHSPPPIPTAARRGGGRLPNTHQIPGGGSGKPPPVPRGRPRPIVRPGKPKASDVIVSRPSVIVGGNAARDVSKRPRPRVQRRDDTIDGLFGGDLISEKSLDEVILAYLSEDTDE